MMSRCRWLVEHRSIVEESGDRVIHTYTDAVVGVTWSHAKPEVPYGEDYPMPHMAVTDLSTGLVIGSYSGTHGGAGLGAERAQEIVDHLRSIMVLDDFVRAV